MQARAPTDTGISTAVCWVYKEDEVCGEVEQAGCRSGSIPFARRWLHA